jgi:hypothetical protein
MISSWAENKNTRWSEQPINALIFQYLELTLKSTHVAMSLVSSRKDSHENVQSLNPVQGSGDDPDRSQTWGH